MDYELAPISEGEWSVLHNSYVVVEVSLPNGEVPNHYEFKLVVNTSATGFQVSGNGVCDWTYPPPASVNQSHWFDTRYPPSKVSESIKLARCGLGLGTGNTSMQVEGRNTQTGAVFVVATTADIPQGWHRHDHQVIYRIASQLLDPNDRPTGVPLTYTPMIQVDVERIINDAADIWSGRHSTYQLWIGETPPMTFDGIASLAGAQGSPRSGNPPIVAPPADVLIKGYWSTEDKCSDTIACTGAAGTYPHIGQEQVLWIEFPPQFPEDLAAGRIPLWTDNPYDEILNYDDYRYLRGTMMHELGHAGGLGHASGSVDSIMSGQTTWLKPQPYDENGMRNIYESHTPN